MVLAAEAPEPEDQSNHSESTVAGKQRGLAVVGFMCNYRNSESVFTDTATPPASLRWVLGDGYVCAGSG